MHNKRQGGRDRTSLPSFDFSDLKLFFSSLPSFLIILVDASFSIVIDLGVSAEGGDRVAGDRIIEPRTFAVGIVINGAVFSMPKHFAVSIASMLAACVFHSIGSNDEHHMLGHILVARVLMNIADMMDRTVRDKAGH